MVTLANTIDETGIDAVLQSGDGEVLIVLVLVFLGGLYLIYKGIHNWRLEQLLKDTPTSNIRSVAVGRTELEGTSKPHDETLDPPLTDADCVYVEWETERREKHTDDDGNVHYTWETTASGKEAVAFVLEDDTGRIIVRADKDDPEFDVRKDKHKQKRNYGRGERADSDVTGFIEGFRARKEQSNDDDGFFGRIAETMSDVFESDPLGKTGRKRRYTQTVFPIEAQTYVFGEARPSDVTHIESGQQDLLEVRRDEGTDEFLIADGTEDKVTDRYDNGIWLIAGGLAASALALWAILSGFWAGV